MSISSVGTFGGLSSSFEVRAFERVLTVVYVP
jgi:hypothetical protein